MPCRPGELKLGATLFHNVCDDISLLWSTVISLPCEVSTEALISDLELTRVSVDRFTAETTVEVDVSSQATDGASRAVGTHHGPTRIHLADYNLLHRRDGRDCNDGTTILYHPRIYRRCQHSFSGMTAGRRELLEHGHRCRIRRSRRTFRGTTGRTEQRAD